MGLLAAPPALALNPDRLLSQYVLDNWQIAEGLPQNSPLALAQTADGYLWIGTFKGLARFDGVRFTVFDGPREAALGDDHVTGLLVDRRGWLWVACDSGAILKHEHGKMTAIHGIPPLPEIRILRQKVSRSQGVA